MTTFANQTNGNILGQSTRNKRSLDNIAAPDTDSRAISLSGLSVTPDFLHDHTRMTYAVPVGNVQTVTFANPINQEDRSLHWLILDNSNNTGSKVFDFGADYHFLDDPTNLTNSYTVTAGAKQVWFGTSVNNELYLRVASTNTN